VRFLLEIFIIGGLIYLGWEIPFKQRIDQWTGVEAATPATSTSTAAASSIVATPTPVPRLRQFPRATVTPSGAWMWDRDHRSPLNVPAHAQPTPQ
jgi:hypothetical protein